MESQFQVTSKFQLDYPNLLRICSYQLLPWTAWRSIARPCKSPDRRFQSHDLLDTVGLKSYTLNRRSGNGMVEWLEHGGWRDRAAEEPSGGRGRRDRGVPTLSIPGAAAGPESGRGSAAPTSNGGGGTAPSFAAADRRRWRRRGRRTASLRRRRWISSWDGAAARTRFEKPLVPIHGPKSIGRGRDGGEWRRWVRARSASGGEGER